MKPDVIARLITINRQFYQTFASPFAASRNHLQPGVIQLLDHLLPASRILDLGCGNGELALALLRSGFEGQYVGLDFSNALIAKTAKKQGILDHAGQFTFIQADLTAPGWHSNVPTLPYDVILAFAVLHHIPGNDLRHRLLGQIREFLNPDGKFVHSNWQFLNSPRLQKRVQPWDVLGLSPADVQPTDYLLDWRRDGYGVRYVHHFSAVTLSELAAGTGFRIVESFFSDGKGGNLALYQIWKKTNINQ
jgi:SAM-dependent methyltransferase